MYTSKKIVFNLPLHIFHILQKFNLPQVYQNPSSVSGTGPFALYTARSLRLEKKEWSWKPIEVSPVGMTPGQCWPNNGRGFATTGPLSSPRWANL